MSSASVRHLSRPSPSAPSSRRRHISSGVTNLKSKQSADCSGGGSGGSAGGGVVVVHDSVPSPAPSARSVRHTPSKGSVGGSGRRSGRRSGRAGSSRLHEDSPAGAGAGAGAGADSDNPATAGPAVDAAPSESASPSHFVTPAARLSRADKIDYTKSLNLRLYRKELLRIRGTLQDIVWRKYKGVRQLMAAFDKDGDGLINKTDWMKSCAETFPIDDGEARLMFEAIDDNGDGVLTYKELCDILEPSTMATFDPALASAMREMSGFVKFSKQQAKYFAGDKPMTPGGTRLQEEVFELKPPSSPAPVDSELKRRPASNAEELEIVKGKILKALAKSGSDDSTVFKVARAFRHMDRKHKKGYLTPPEFTEMLTSHFGIQLSERQQLVTLLKVADRGTGAVDLGSFTDFLSKSYMPAVDAMADLARRGLRTMKEQAEMDSKLSASFADRLPPTPHDPFLAATQLPLSPVAVSGRHRRPYTSSTLHSVRSSASGGVFGAAGQTMTSGTSLHPLFELQLSRGTEAAVPRVDPRVGATHLPPRAGVDRTGAFDRGQSGLTSAAEQILAETRTVGPRRPQASYPWSSKDEVKETIRAPTDTAAYASPSDQFVKKSDPRYLTGEQFTDTKAQLRQNRAHRRMAGERRAIEATERQCLMAGEMDRRRIASKRRQKLNFMSKTID